MQIREKKMAQEEDKKVDHTWQETEQTTVQRALALATLENECRKKLVEANCRYNQALVRTLKTKLKNVNSKKTNSRFEFRRPSKR